LQIEISSKTIMLSIIHRHLLSQRPIAPLVDVFRPVAVVVGRRMTSSKVSSSNKQRWDTHDAPNKFKKRTFSTQQLPDDFTKSLFSNPGAAFGSFFAAATFGLAAYETFCSDERSSGSFRRPPTQSEMKKMPRDSMETFDLRRNFEKDWDDFMKKSIAPGEDEEEEDGGEISEQRENDPVDDRNKHKAGRDEDISEHQERFKLALPTAAQEEHVQGCENSVPSENRIFERHFWTNEHESAGENFDLDDWFKYIESRVKARSLKRKINNDVEEEEDDDDDDIDDEDDDDLIGGLLGPNFVTAAVRFRLRDSKTGHSALLVYVRDQNNRLLGMKRFEEIPFDEETGKCDFLILPGQTGAVRVFVIYEGPSGKLARGKGRKMYYSPLVPIPSVPKKFDVDEDAGDENWVPCA